MEEKKEFGLIGKNISYSFSKNFFEKKFKKLFLKNYSYGLYSLDKIEDFKELINTHNFTGLNVTIPFKTEIIPYLDDLDDTAKKVGAVNCIQFISGKTKGYNTDVFGFEETLKIHRKPEHRSALILGNGGAAKAVKYVLEQYQIPYTVVFRNSELNFERLSEKEVSENLLIIQTTPVGTFPDTEDVLKFPFNGLSDQHLVIDLIYNPNRTKFLLLSQRQGAKTINGFYMLEQQAEKSWKIWSDRQK